MNRFLIFFLLSFFLHIALGAMLVFRTGILSGKGESSVKSEIIPEFSEEKVNIEETNKAERPKSKPSKADSKDETSKSKPKSKPSKAEELKDESSNKAESTKSKNPKVKVKAEPKSKNSSKAEELKDETKSETKSETSKEDLKENLKSEPKSEPIKEDLKDETEGEAEAEPKSEPSKEDSKSETEGETEAESLNKADSKDETSKEAEPNDKNPSKAEELKDESSNKAESTKSKNPKDEKAFGTSRVLPALNLANARKHTQLRQIDGNPVPVYPKKALRNKWQGRVELIYYVNPAGFVEKIQLKKSSGYSLLDNSALRALARYRYYPGQEGWVVHPVEFMLDLEKETLEVTPLGTRTPSGVVLL